MPRGRPRKEDGAEAPAPATEEKLPVIKSLSLFKTPGTNLWCVLTLYSRGNQIIKVEKTEDNMKAIAQDELKIAVVKSFFDPLRIEEQPEDFSDEVE